MKDLFKSVFNRKTITPVLFWLGVFFLLTFIVFPGLTYSNTFINIMSLIVGLITLIVVFYYLKLDKLVSNEEPPTKEEVVTKPKKMTAVKKPSKPRKPKKSEFPMEPHKPIKKTKNK